MNRQQLDAKEEELAQEKIKVNDLNRRITGLNEDILDRANKIEVLEQERNKLKEELTKAKENVLKREVPSQPGIQVCFFIISDGHQRDGKDQGLRRILPKCRLY